MDEKLRNAVAAAQAASSKEEALAIAAEAVISELATAMEASKLPDVAAQIGALRTSGLDRLLVEGLAAGRVTVPMARDHVQRMLRALRDRAIGVHELKAGILAFDESAQRLSISVGPDGNFRYPHLTNPVRDLLIALALSLHR